MSEENNLLQNSSSQQEIELTETSVASPPTSPAQQEQPPAATPLAPTTSTKTNEEEPPTSTTKSRTLQFIDTICTSGNTLCLLFTTIFVIFVPLFIAAIVGFAATSSGFASVSCKFPPPNKLPGGYAKNFFFDTYTYKRFTLERIFQPCVLTILPRELFGLNFDKTLKDNRDKPEFQELIDNKTRLYDSITNQGTEPAEINALCSYSFLQFTNMDLGGIKAQIRSSSAFKLQKESTCSVGTDFGTMIATRTFPFQLTNQQLLSTSSSAAAYQFMTGVEHIVNSTLNTSLATAFSFDYSTVSPELIVKTTAFHNADIFSSLKESGTILLASLIPFAITFVVFTLIFLYRKASTVAEKKLTEIDRQQNQYLEVESVEMALTASEKKTAVMSEDDRAQANQYLVAKRQKPQEVFVVGLVYSYFHLLVAASFIGLVIQILLFIKMIVTNTSMTTDSYGAVSKRWTWYVDQIAFYGYGFLLTNLSVIQLNGYLKKPIHWLFWVVVAVNLVLTVILRIIFFVVPGVTVEAGNIALYVFVAAVYCLESLALPYVAQLVSRVKGFSVRLPFLLIAPAALVAGYFCMVNYWLLDFYMMGDVWLQQLIQIAIYLITVLFSCVAAFGQPHYRGKDNGFTEFFDGNGAIQVSTIGKVLKRFLARMLIVFSTNYTSVMISIAIITLFDLVIFGVNISLLLSVKHFKLATSSGKLEYLVGLCTPKKKKKAGEAAAETPAVESAGESLANSADLAGGIGAGMEEKKRKELLREAIGQYLIGNIVDFVAIMAMPVIFYMMSSKLTIAVDSTLLSSVVMTQLGFKVVGTVIAAIALYHKLKRELFNIFSRLFSKYYGFFAYTLVLMAMFMSYLVQSVFTNEPFLRTNPIDSLDTFV